MLLLVVVSFISVHPSVIVGIVVLIELLDNFRGANIHLGLTIVVATTSFFSFLLLLALFFLSFLLALLTASLFLGFLGLLLLWTQSFFNFESIMETFDIVRQLIVILLLIDCYPVSSLLKHALLNVHTLVFVNFFFYLFFLSQVCSIVALLDVLAFLRLLLHFLDWVVSLLFRSLLAGGHTQELHLFRSEVFDILSCEDSPHSLLNKCASLLFFL